MREKLGVVTFAVVLVVVWGVGFLWFRGDLSFSPTQAPAKAAPTSSPSPSTSAVPSATGSPRAEPTYAGNVSGDDERRAVDLNPVALRPRPVALPPVVDFTMATFNILGSSHTKQGGEHSGRASGPQRVGGALQILAQHQISVVGLQEFQGDQRATFDRIAQGWTRYPGPDAGARAGENSVAWRTDTWELVKPGLVSIPYFNGNVRPMPFVLLRHRETGVAAYFSSFHNPADTGQFRNQQRFRTAATTREIALFNQLEETGIPQFVTGDMNERDNYFCRVTGSTPLRAAAGGSTEGGCSVPRPTQIDWILGSPGAIFSDYQVDRSPLVRRTTDHPVVVTDVRIDALKYAKAYTPTAATSP